LGEPHLYTALASMKAGRNVDTLTTRFGIRTVELVTEPDSIGETFFFRVNGTPVFMKGANVIPLDHFSPRVTEDDYRSLFQDVAEASMNMLRVWGGGIYEEDVFYDMADEHGILIWQDFMFANGMYPGDSSFLANVEAEAIDQVRRLRGHASLALWCGNNEMDEGWKNWGWGRNYDTPSDSAAVRDAYESIFHQILPGVVRAEDPGRRYWPSSPSLGWGDPKSLNRGDSHYWGVWHGQEPFQVFAEKLPRFSSEFGFQAFPSMETVAAFTYPEDRSLFDPTILAHQKHPIGNELIIDYMGREYPVPEGLDDFVYVSQLLQAKGMLTAFEAHRRAMPRTMGTLYWQLNDTWPVVSWSGRDYFGRWKALHYAAKKAFATTLVSSVLKEGSMEIWGVREAQDPAEGMLDLRLLDFSGSVLWEDSVQVNLDKRESKVLWTGPRPLTEELDTRRVVLATDLRLDSRDGDVPSSLLYFHPPKELNLEVPTIRFDLEEGEESLRITLETDVLAKGVFLMLKDGRFSENFFDLLPGRPRTTSIWTDKPLEQVRAELQVRTLADVPKEGFEVDDSGTPAPAR
ncbi:MAG: glycoside hydrolase family 2 protein, partial [Gemmatimonadetes bacterium]|nr:glycoside hydrolase family 2 protein [Gemmatimonadota bacterium]